MATLALRRCRDRSRGQVIAAAIPSQRWSVRLVRSCCQPDKPNLFRWTGQEWKLLLHQRRDTSQP
jgi:hypothetical protein